ncbi:MAG: hypothetical protein U9Q07_06180 [Planctomycetota bacterium]|nr:hypothetical protein [Planctomycetota bacterium]
MKDEKKDDPLYDFIRRDSAQREMIHCTHPEASGVFLIRKPTFAVRGDIGRAKGAYLGAFPDPDSDIDAELFATVLVGFEKTPEGFNPGEVISFKLMEGLFQEVSAYWRTFRDQ